MSESQVSTRPWSRRAGELNQLLHEYRYWHEKAENPPPRQKWRMRYYEEQARNRLLEFLDREGQNITLLMHEQGL